MKRGKHVLKYAAGMLVLLATTARAQDPGKDSSGVHRIREVVVSATRSEQSPDSVGRSITVISSEQIRNSGVNTLAELLSREEGIYIVGTAQTPGQLQNVFMRGANSNQTAIMVDGIRMTDPSSADNAIDFSEISLANIERVEIVRGAQSTMYGSSAIGGVINIITKKCGTPGMHVDAGITGGLDQQQTWMSTQQLGLNYNLKNGFYARAEIYHSGTNGLDATVDTVTDKNNYIHNHRARNPFNKTDALAKLGYHSETLDVFAGYKNVHQKSNIDQGAFTDDPAYTVDFTRNLFNWGANYKLTRKISIDYTGGMTSMKRTAIDDSSVVDALGTYNHNYFKGVYTGSTLTNEVQANYRSKGISAVLGVAMFNEKMSTDVFEYNTAYGIYTTHLNLDSLHINVNTTSLFAHVDLDGSLFSDSWKVFNLGLGVRNTNHQLFGNNLTWEINPSLKVASNGLLFASFATGFNAPSLYQLYDADTDPGSHITRGNPTLKAETSSSMEFGFKQRVNEHISFHVSFFKTVVDNSIDYVYLWKKNKPVDSLTYLDYQGDTYVNIGRQTNQGFELGLSTRVTETFFVNANVSLINGRLDYDPASINPAHTQGNQVQLFENGAFMSNKVTTYGLVRRPSTANISASWRPCPKLFLEGDVRYVGPRSDVYYSSVLGPNGALATKGMGDYTLVDFSARYQLMKGLSAGIRIENLFDEKYYEIYGYTTRGRTFYLNLRYSF
ncbi:MAG TPA: TonB-dependent receptor [Bacteroidia bacterium]|nr:TonB-dependent receptor [Bacteroidia bacterium]